MADTMVEQLFEDLQQVQWRNGQYRKALLQIKALIEQERLLSIRDVVLEVLKETEPQFHCHHCHQDKPRSLRSRECSGMCQECADACNPRLHPELLKDRYPHLCEQYMVELEAYKKEHAFYVAHGHAPWQQKG